MTPTTRTGPSLDPASFSGGMLDDQDFTIAQARYNIFDYDGHAQDTLSLRLDIQTDDGGEYTEQLTMGGRSLEHFTPTEDGCGLELTGDRTTFPKGTKFAMFMTSLVNKGFPQDKLQSADPRVLEGLRAHGKRIPMPRMGGDAGPDAKQSTALTVAEIHQLPWENKAKGKAAASGGGGGATKTATKAAASTGAKKSAAPSGEELDEALYPIVKEIVDGAEGEGLTPRQLVQKVLKASSGKGYDAGFQKAAVKRANEEEFLLAGFAEGHWAFDGETVSAAE